jgi:hypothetical protein
VAACSARAAGCDAVIGILAPVTPPEELLAAFKRGLREHGLVLDDVEAAARNLGDAGVPEGSGAATCPEAALTRAAATADSSPRGPTFAFLNHSSASSRPAFVAFFYGAHSTFSLRANTEAGRADHHTDTRRRRPFLNDPAPLRGRLLDDVVVRKGWRNNESRKSGTGQNCTHGKSLSRSRFQSASFNSPGGVQVPTRGGTLASRTQAGLVSAWALSAGEARTIAALLFSHRQVRSWSSSDCSAAAKSSPRAQKRSNTAHTASRTAPKARLSSPPTARSLPLSAPTLLGCAPAAWLWRAALGQRRYFRKSSPNG